MRILILITFFWCSIGMLVAQETYREQRVTENGKTYFLHKIQPGETLYSIGKQFNVDILIISGVNPQIADGLKSGEVIKIPVVQDGNNQIQEPGHKKPSHFISHIVQRKETLYNISKKYGITIDQILEYNPRVSDLMKGEVLRIPQWNPDMEIKAPLRSGETEGGSISHVVTPGENWYAIARMYGISVSFLRESNPAVLQLKPGMRLVIPSGSAVSSEKPEKAQEFTDHRIVPGETLYSLSRTYNVSADRLIELNPALKRSCKTGTMIRIPVKGKVEKNIIFARSEPETKPTPDDHPVVKNTSDCLPEPVSTRENQTIKVAMLLPVMLADNKALNEQILANFHNESPEINEVISDTLRTDTKISSQLQFQGNSENFIQFYEGALLAIDSLQQLGIKVDLEVWDTEQKSSKIKNLVSSGVLNSAGLIIGPVYPNEQKEITEFADKHRIPLVSPLSPSDEYLKENEFCFQVNPSKEYIAEKTNEYIISTFRNSNLIVLQTNNSVSEAENEAAKLRQELEKNGGRSNHTTIGICNFRKDGYASLHDKMVKDRENVLVFPTLNEAEVSVVVSNIKNLTADFNVTLVGNSRFLQFETIDPEYFHMGRLEFLTPYWPDMNQAVTRSFINKFRFYYRTDPNQYSIQGYDVTFFFVKALNDFGSDLRKCITKEKAELVQGTYRFSKLSSGGYFNNGLSVIQYLPSFEIVRKKVLED